MSVLASYLRGAGALTGQAIFQRLLGAASSIVLARGLGVAGFGAYSAVVYTASSAFGMVKLGVDTAIHVYAARAKGDPADNHVTGQLLGAGLSVLAAGGVVASVVIAVGANWLAEAVFGDPSLAALLRSAGLLTALQCLIQFGHSVLAGFQEFSVYARRMVVGSVVVLVLSATGMWVYGLPGALTGYGLSQFALAVSLGYAAARAMRARKISMSLARPGRAITSLMRLGLPFYGSGLVAIPVFYYLQGLLSRSAGVESLGLLRVIATLTTIVAFVPGSVAAVTTSSLTRLRAEQGTRESKVYDYAILNVKAIWYLTTVSAVVLAIFTPLLVSLVFGPAYASAIEPGMVALFATAFSTTAAAAGSLFFAMERSGIIFWQYVLQSLVLAVVGLIAIPAMGLLGYVSAELAGNAVGLAFVLSVVARVSGDGWIRNGHAWAFGLSTFASIAAIVVVGCFELHLRVLSLALTLALMTLGLWRFGLSDWEVSVTKDMISQFRRLRSERS